MLLSSRSLPLGNDPVPLAGFFASLSVTVFEIQECDYAIRTNDHAGGCGRDSRNHNFSGPRMISVPAPNAEATPAIGKGQPCKTCHTSTKPSKSDLKK